MFIQWPTVTQSEPSLKEATLFTSREDRNFQARGPTAIKGTLLLLLLLNTFCYRNKLYYITVHFPSQNKYYYVIFSFYDSIFSALNYILLPSHLVNKESQNLKHHGSFELKIAIIRSFQRSYFIIYDGTCAGLK